MSSEGASHIALTFYFLYFFGINLFQIVVEILAYPLVQVHALVAAHVVRLAWIDEVVTLDAILNTLL